MHSITAGDRAGRSTQPGSEKTRIRARRARWLAGLGAATALWLLAQCGLVAVADPASAHAVPVSAAPAPGASLTRPPALLRIVFSEPLAPGLSGVVLRASSGTAEPARSAGVDPHDASAYELALPRLRPGRYTVIWHTTSRIDGHVRWGSYAFTLLESDGAAPPAVSAASGPPAGPAPLPALVQAAASWAGLAGLFLVTGAALMLLLGGGARAPARRPFRWLLAAAGLGTFLGAGGQSAATWAGTGWRAAALPGVLGDGSARWLWLRMGAMAVVLLAWPPRARTARPARRTALARKTPPIRKTVLAAAVLVMVVSYAATGHGAASAHPVAGLAFMSVHILAASVWLGGVLGLATVWSLGRRPGERRTLLRRFSLVAGMAVPAVAATGAASALLELGSVTDFVRSEYGITLLVKLAVAAAVGAAAVSNVLVRRRGPVIAAEGAGRVRAGLWAEAGLGLLILVPAATMSVLGPPGPADAARAPAAVAPPWGAASHVTPVSAPGATTWPVGGHGLMMPAVAPDGSVWIGEMGSSTLTRLSPDRGVVRRFTLPGGYKEVMGVAVDDDGRVWIAEEHAQALGMFDPATGRYRQYAIPGGDPAPVGVAVGASGQVWFTMMNGNGIGRLDPGTARVTEYPVPTAHALPYWLAAGPHGQVWFTEFGAGKLGVLNSATGTIGEYPLPDGSSPAGIAIAPSGSVWAAATQGLLIRMDASTGAMRIFRTPRPDDYGVAVTGDGTVWVGLASGPAVYSFDPATAAFAAHRLPAGSDPWWVAAGPAHVWVALSPDAPGGLSELNAVS